MYPADVTVFYMIRMPTFYEEQNKGCSGLSFSCNNPVSWCYKRSYYTTTPSKSHLVLWGLRQGGVSGGNEGNNNINVQSQTNSGAAVVIFSIGLSICSVSITRLLFQL